MRIDPILPFGPTWGQTVNRLLLTTALLAILPATNALAGNVNPSVPATINSNHVTFLVGIAAEFGDTKPDVGITGKVLAGPFSNVVAGGGVTYLFGSQQIGLDLSAGLNLNGATVLGGYDFTTQQPQVSAGYAPVFTTLTCPARLQLQGTTCYPPSSDRRLKRGIVHIATLSDGIKLYSFRYAWSDEVYVGVMAQDLLDDPRYAHAVSVGEDGFYRVDYDQLDLVMVTLEQWNEHGLDAVVLGERPATLWVDQAA